MRRLIKNWKELSEIPNESATHILEVEVENGCAWLRSKEPRELNRKRSFMRQIKHMDIYLSTHSFYGKGQHKQASKLLRAYGFDVELDNWDK